MKRRDLIALVPLSVALSSLSAVAQQTPPKKRLGLLAVGDVSGGQSVFAKTLEQLGWTEGKSLIIDRRFWGIPERLAPSAVDLVALRPDVLVGVGADDVKALRAATNTIPIVFIVVSDPVALGYAQTLARPGGNITGVASMTPELELKQLELVHELLPEAKRISMLRDLENPGSSDRFDADQVAAATLGLALVRRQTTSASDIDAAFAAAAADHDDAVHVEFSGLTIRENARIAKLAARYRLPTICGSRAYTTVGALLSYGSAPSENYRAAAVLVDKVLRGAEPAELPIEQPTKFELVINLKTAKVLGLTVPQSLLARADELIE
jgi:putative tryptophan/tyrosine transport system substrate-binding protein